MTLRWLCVGVGVVDTRVLWRVDIWKKDRIWRTICSEECGQIIIVWLGVWGLMNWYQTYGKWWRGSTAGKKKGTVSYQDEELCLHLPLHSKASIFLQLAARVRNMDANQIQRQWWCHSKPTISCRIRRDRFVKYALKWRAIENGKMKRSNINIEGVRTRWKLLKSSRQEAFRHPVISHLWWAYAHKG